MIVMICIDDNNGMMFNNRRQSRDQMVIDDIAKIAKDNKLYMSEYSYKIFINKNLSNIVISSNFLQEIKEGEFCFIEDIDMTPFSKQIEKLIIYKWNRIYPADFHLNIQLENWKLLETKDFIGKSHDKITREIYLLNE